ncbi:hypothetical protein DYB30_002385 [Aphanomyces astaci]|uniref:LNR domain-containing protein n=1 Tax=Aphanomyces astaci TaxID=112090 RepID=A0A397DJR5_APHAT|nr:hypothetical protein DYB30_002385 [Aphanomyces astaci]
MAKTPGTGKGSKLSALRSHGSPSAKFDSDAALIEEIKRLQPPSPQPTHWRRWLAAAIAFVAVHVALVIVLLHDADPGYFYSRRYPNIGNINLETDAPFMGYPPIDVVYTWVNGSDPRWKREKDHWHRRWKAQIQGDIFDETDESEVFDASAAATENRFRDNEELRYSLRSIEMYAPWVRHVYLVTDGQIPNWLNVESPRLTIVPHRSIFANQSHLPVFSSPAIEANLDKIPGLSSLFLYFNDDVFLGAPVTPEDFISPSGVQNIYLSWEVPECSKGCREFNLGNQICDPSCNTTACAFDMGDCGCLEVPTSDPLVFDVVCAPPSASNTATTDVSPVADTEQPVKTANPLNCMDGCSWTWIGDGTCDVLCNVTQCGFDAGDCSLKALEALPTLDLTTKAPGTTYGVHVPGDADALVVHLPRPFFEFLDRATLLGDQLVRRAVLLEQNMTLVLVFARKDTTGTSTGGAVVSVDGELADESTAQWTLHVLRGHHTLPHAGMWSVLSSDLAELKMTRRLHPNASTLVDLQIELPYHSIPDWSMPMTVSNKLEPSISRSVVCPPILPPVGDAGSSDEDDGATDDAAVDTGEDHAAVGCMLDGRRVLLQWQWNASLDAGAFVSGDICTNNAHVESCVHAVLSLRGGVTWVPPTPKRQEPVVWTGEWHAFEDCVVSDWFQGAIGGGLVGQCSVVVETDALDDAPPPPGPPAVDLEVAKKAKAMCSSIARRLKARSNESTWWGLSKVRDGWLAVKTWLHVNTVEVLDTPRHHMLSTDDVAACETYFASRPVELPTVSADADAVTSVDTFGDSLRFVNKLYNAQFGKVDGPVRRRVPSHMPHFIQKSLLTEMKDHWAAEFNATSSHRFRHPKDMQFSFSYMYYVVNRHKLHPPTIDDIFSTYIDINRDGLIDEHEALSVASLLTSESDIASVKACMTPSTTETKREEIHRHGIVTVTETTQPYLTLDSLKACDNVTHRLIETATKRLPPTHVTFHMLSDQYRTAWNQLLNTRAKRTKFICINDDMKYPTVAVGNILNDLFTSLWPQRSQFELPYHLKNRFGHVDELAWAVRTQYIVMGAVGTLVAVAVAACFWWEQKRPLEKTLAVDEDKDNEDHM